MLRRAPSSSARPQPTCSYRDTPRAHPSAATGARRAAYRNLKTNVPGSRRVNTGTLSFGRSRCADARIGRHPSASAGRTFTPACARQCGNLRVDGRQCSSSSKGGAVRLRRHGACFRGGRAQHRPPKPCSDRIKTPHAQRSFGSLPCQPTLSSPRSRSRDSGASRDVVPA
jgi:hypothetical protein